PPDPPRPSLKRSRSSPTLSPPLHQKALTLPAPSSYPSEITKPATTTRSSGVADPDSFTPNHTILTSPAPSSSLSETSNLATTTLSSGVAGPDSTPPNLIPQISDPNLSCLLSLGLNDSDKHRPFVSWLNSQHVYFGALLETHIKELTLPHIMSSICPRWNYASNHQADDDGRVILIWRDPLSVSIISQSRQSVTCEIKIPGLPAFIYTAVYAANTSQERTDLWTELTHLHSVFDLDSKPWMMGGDFNQILHSTEQSVPFDYNNSSAMYQFRDTLVQVGLFDSRFQGPSFSWSNKQHALPIAKKLDRMLLNYASIQSFPHATSFFQAPMISDHSPCLTDLAFPLPKAGTQPFKFLNYLTKHPNFHQVVQDAWIQAGSLCMDLASLCWKLKNIKRELRTLNKENFSNIQERVQSLDSPSAETFLQDKRLTLLCWQSTIYFIWRERNDRLHRANFRSPELIIRGLDRLIRNRIQSIRVENPRSSSAMMQDWLGSN
ncbi:hypothetical protein IGI04_015527, partial [Brassica rapa subsp. trilocularis]